MYNSCENAISCPPRIPIGNASVVMMFPWLVDKAVELLGLWLLFLLEITTRSSASLALLDAAGPLPI